MTSFRQHSLLLRAGLAMAGVTLLALLSMGASIVIAERLGGQAAAMNQAGALRMQSFVITTRLLSEEGYANLNYGQAVARAVEEFESRLLHPELSSVLPKDPGHALYTAYVDITSEWRGEVRPLIAVYLYNVEPASKLAPTETLRDLRRQLVSRIHAYVERVDRFVGQLEQAARTEVMWLRLFLGMALLLTLGAVTFTMRLLRTGVARPLRDLLDGAERARRGDFSARVQHTGEDELGQLGRAFNAMAEDLSKMYTGLETRVHDKTAALERRNRSLELLYHTITRLTAGPVSDAAYTVLLRRIENALGVGPSAICLAEDPADGHARLLVTTALDAGGHGFLCDDRCATCLNQGETQLRDVRAGVRTHRLFSVPLRDQEGHYGVLQVEVPVDRELDLWQEQIVETIGWHIGIALGTRRRAAQGRRLALLEERTVIARELHDSLAQSLSYLRIQVSRLQALPARGADAGESRAILNELREGINNAHRQLRELLTTFRLKMDGRGLAPALEATVEEFRQRAAGNGVATGFVLDNRLAGCPLNVNEEIHILQIVREALSNVVRHARASQASVALDYAQDTVSVTVDDNGLGCTAAEPGNPHHYGLAIMQERARGLGGDVRILRRDGGGTRVELRFTPAEQRRGPAAPTRH